MTGSTGDRYSHGPQLDEKADVVEVNVESTVDPDAAVPRRAVPWPWVIFGLGSATGLAMALVVFRVQSLVDSNIDPYFFGEMGESIADGRGFEGFGSLITRRAPLYPLMIGGVYAIFGEHQRLIIVLQAFMFAGTCVLAYDMGRRLFNQRTGVIAGVACAIHPMLLRYIPTLHLETQLTLLMTLVVWLMVRFYERPSVTAGALVGAAAGAAALTKAVVVVYPALFVVGIILTAVAARKRGHDAPTPWRSLVAMFVLMGCRSLPWTIRNYGITGHFVPISSRHQRRVPAGLHLQRDGLHHAARAAVHRRRERQQRVLPAGSPRRPKAPCGNATTTRPIRSSTTRPIADSPRSRARGPQDRRRPVHVLVPVDVAQRTRSSVPFLAVGRVALSRSSAGAGSPERRPVRGCCCSPILYLNLLLALLLALGRYSVTGDRRRSW